MSDLDRYQYGYDQNSNRLYKANVVGTAAVGYLDEGYTYDNLNRLTMMQRGNLSSGVITGTPAREMDYTLDPTGNWSAYLTKTNGTTDLNQTRTANTVNEITAIGGTPAWATPPVYDAAGNMTSFPQPATPSSSFVATYDAWNRMTSLNTSGGTAVATYQYDGRGRRIGQTTASIPETRHFYYTSAWQDVEERVGASTTMDKQYVWGVRYIDELVCRDDATPQRLYAMQDANFNLTSICNTSGGVVERYRFDPYGNRTVMNASWGVISASAYSWVIGHQGLTLDGESGLNFNRSRYQHPTLGLLVQRDPIAYGGGFNLYSYVQSNPIRYVDPHGKCELDLNPNGPLNPVPHWGQMIDSSSWIASLMPESMYDFYTNLMKQRTAWPSSNDTLELGGTFLNEIIALPDIQDDMKAVRVTVKLDILSHLNKMCESGCTLKDRGSFPITAPMGSPNIRLSLQRFQIFWTAECDVTSCSCDVSTHKLHSKWKCKIDWSLFDIFDFRSWEPYGWLGIPFNVYGGWDDGIHGQT